MKEHNLIIRYFRNKVLINDLYTNIIQSLSDKDYNSNLKSLFDFREAEFNIDMDEIRIFADNIRKHPSLQTKRIIVFLTHTPNQVVFSNLLESFQKYKRFQIHTVSGIDTAISQFGIKKSVRTLIEEAINNMKSST
ncbi:hypothetical protein [Carboxylicivirga caseinilyticus]|uniref:hypothetical protein n=1 Tax=Carboxylicivirga caseinilyticus TaxID=3417572 RepID=UPI003D34BF25|nr:hypothetical protein [Marinilabiliaceae bacterium A049]